MGEFLGRMSPPTRWLGLLVIVLITWVWTVHGDDPFRPQCHAVPPSEWINDPNGPIYYNGTYHLFFQYNPDAAVWGIIHWGHMVSPDMIRWSWKGMALNPGSSELDPDHTGCWTGSAAIDITGSNLPTILYTGVRTGDYIESQMIAVAADESISSWTRLPNVNPVIPRPPDLPGTVSGFRDPSFWYDDSISKWRLIIGSGVENQGGYVLTYTADQLTGPWNYLNPLLESNTTEYHGDMWECPDFFQLPTLSGHTSRWVLIFGDDQAQKNYYMIGDFDQTANRFIPDPMFAEKGRILDAGNYYAAKTMLDSHTGNRVLWGWSPEARSVDAYSAAGWAGIQTIPRILHLSDDGTSLVFQTPHALDTLIENPVTSGTQLWVEVLFQFVANSSDPVGVDVFASSDRQEYTRISFTPSSRELSVNRTFSSLSPEADHSVQSSVVPQVNARQTTELRLHIILDHSMAEIFADGVACITRYGVLLRRLNNHSHQGAVVYILR